VKESDSESGNSEWGAHEQKVQKGNGRSRSRPQELACHVHLFQGNPTYVTEKPLHY